MEIRPVRPEDLQALADIDGTVESNEYLHLEQSGEGLTLSWRIEKRPLRQKLIQSNPISDENSFILKQISSGADEGLAIVAEHEGAPVAALLAWPDYSVGTLRILDLRVDYD